MHLQITSYAIISAFTATVALLVAGLAWQRRMVPGGKSLAALMLAVAIWAGGAFFEYSSATFSFILLWAKVEYIGGVSSPVFFLLFVLEYNHMHKWLTPRVIAWLFVVPLLTFLLVLTNEWHGLIWPNLALATSGPPRMIYGHGPAYWLGAIGYAYLLLAVGTGMLIWFAFHHIGPYRRQAELVAASGLVPWIVNILGMMGVAPFTEWEPTPLALVISGILIAWGIFRFDLLDLIPAARDMLIEKMADGMIVVNGQNRIVEINPAAQAVLGLAQESAIGQNIKTWMPNLYEAVQRAVGEYKHQVDVTLARNSTTLVFDLQVLPLTQTNGRPLGYLIVLHDITERKHAEEVLREREAELRALIDYSPASTIKFSPEGKIMFWNAMAEKMYGWTAEEVLGKLLPTVPPDQQFERLDMQARVNQSKVIAYTEVKRQRKDGSPIHIGLSVAPLYDAEGKVYAQMSISTDISELKHAQFELARREQTVALLEERARLGRDLHDSVTQLLYSIMLFADASQDAAQNANVELTRQYLARLSETARQALKELRLRVFELRPSVLEHEGLVSALRQRLDLVEQRAGVATELKVELPRALPAPVEVAMYWIVQEGLNNILKHANATRVEIEIRTDETGLHGAVTDNGKGFDLASLRNRTGLGLINMQERARELGGTFEIFSAPDQGTRILVNLPAYVVEQSMHGTDYSRQESRQ